MELGAQLDRTNAEFFAGQDIRRGQAAAAEQRLTIDKAGEDTRATQRVVGQERRAEIGETGLQYRRGLETAGEQDRKRDLQQEMFRRYKENRDYEQAQSQYKT
jgi:Tat protein secretion system quality control protein TatD with DNase activity